MNLPPLIRYHLMVDLVGTAALRLDRLRLTKKLLLARRDPFFGPPLRSSARLKELISHHYLKGQYANGCRPVAWVTSGAPSEFLSALGFHLHYPENHGAVCGIRRVADEACGRAEEAGWSQNICSYARIDIGTALSGITPVGRIPRPDLLFCCTNICQTVLYWYQVLAEHFQAPLIVIDTPFLYGQAPEHAVEFVKRQIEASVPIAERVAKRTLSERQLRKTTGYAKQAVELWMAVLDQAQHRPAPISAFDAFIHMAPIVEMRGEPFTVDYYAGLLAELKRRARAGIGSVKGERRRLLWDNLPVWPRVRWLSELLAKCGVALVASTYTNAWGELKDLIDAKDPLGSAARAYIRPILNQGTGHKLAVIKHMVRAYHADGVILHSDRSCKPYSMGQIDQRDRLAKESGVPSLLLEADHADTRAFSDEQAATRIEAFLEQLER